MFFQKVLKGITGLTRDEANLVFESGILCNWWWNQRTINNQQIAEQLTEENLDWHLNHYDDIDPRTKRPFGESSPYISLTAGAVERDTFLRGNIVFDPFFTALRFATQDFKTVGHVFYGHVYTLGRQSIPLVEFAEEVRELNIYRSYMPFHPEGEITAKINVLGPQIEMWEEYDGPVAEKELLAGTFPKRAECGVNPLYARPEQYCNIRGLVTD